MCTKAHAKRLVELLRDTDATLELLPKKVDPVRGGKMDEETLARDFMLSATAPIMRQHGDRARKRWF